MPGYKLGILPAIAVIKPQDQNQLWKEKVCFNSQLIVHHETESGQGLKTGTRSQEPKEGPRRSAAHWFVSTEDWVP